MNCCEEYVLPGSYLITGVSGFVGSCLARKLLSAEADVTVTAPVRNLSKARRHFPDNPQGLKLLETDVMEFCTAHSGDYDYIIHCASPTSGQYMATHPVETYEFILNSTIGLLKMSLGGGRLKSFIFVSSVEFYGDVDDDTVQLTEDMSGKIDFDSPRSSYPLAKQAAEFACKCYAAEYGVPVRIARLTQTFGEGIDPADTRVFSQFARSVAEGRDIVLHTEGTSCKPYCHSSDMVSAVLTILYRGENGRSYNVANPDTYISIRGLAEFLRDNFNKEIGVRVELHPEIHYAPPTKLRLSVDRLMRLGWRPRVGLRDMFARYIDYLKSIGPERS